jgi:hypothetical protein
MPLLMLAKCAEAQAIRKGWPEDLANAYVSEEVAHAALDPPPAPTAADAAAAADAALCDRLERVGAKVVLILDWLDGAPLDAVPLGAVAARIVAFLRARRGDRQTLGTWRDRNRHALRELWARAPAAALDVKVELENARAGGAPDTPRPGRPTRKWRFNYASDCAVRYDLAGRVQALLPQRSGLARFS